MQTNAAPRLRQDRALAAGRPAAGRERADRKVAQLGAGASKFAVGDRVVSMEPWKCVSACSRTMSASHASTCPAHTYLTALPPGALSAEPSLSRCASCRQTGAGQGTWQQYVVVPEADLVGPAARLS